MPKQIEPRCGVRIGLGFGLGFGIPDDMVESSEISRSALQADSVSDETSKTHGVSLSSRMRGLYPRFAV